MNAVVGLEWTNERDALLMQGIVERDTAAFELFYDHHAQAVFHVLSRMVKDPSVAEDLLQETFWQVWRKAEQYRGSGPVVGWLLRMARNRAIDHLRRQKTQGQRNTLGWATLQAMDDAARSLAQPQKSIEEEVEMRLTTHLLHYALKAIPAEQRLCVELAYFEEMSHNEIAHCIKLPLGTIKTRIQSGMDKLRRSLQAQAVELRV